MWTGRAERWLAHCTRVDYKVAERARARAPRARARVRRGEREEKERVREKAIARASERGERDRESETGTDSAQGNRFERRAHTHTPAAWCKKDMDDQGEPAARGGGGVGLRQASGSETVQEWAKHFHSFKSFPERSVAVTEHLQQNKRQSLRGERGGGEVAGDGGLRGFGRERRGTHGRQCVCKCMCVRAYVSACVC